MKMLLHITRLGDFMGHRFDINPVCLNTANYVERDLFEEVAGWMEYDTCRAPVAAYKLNIGDSIRVKVNVKCDFHVDYYGEQSEEVYFVGKQRVIWRSKR